MEANWGPHWDPSDNLNTIVLICSRGALNCYPMMPRDASLSESYKYASSLVPTHVCKIDELLMHYLIICYSNDDDNPYRHFLTPLCTIWLSIEEPSGHLTPSVPYCDAWHTGVSERPSCSREASVSWSVARVMVEEVTDGMTMHHVFFDCATQRIFFRNPIKSNRTQIVFIIFQLIWNSKLTLSVCCFISFGKWYTQSDFGLI